MEQEGLDEQIEDCKRHLDVYSTSMHLPLLPEGAETQTLNDLKQKLTQLDSELQSISSNVSVRTSRVIELSEMLPPLQQYHILLDHRFVLLDALIFATRRRNASADIDNEPQHEVDPGIGDSEIADARRIADTLASENRAYRLRETRFQLGPLLRRWNASGASLRPLALALQNELSQLEVSLAAHTPFARREWKNAQIKPDDLLYARRRAGIHRRVPDLPVGDPHTRYLSVVGARHQPSDWTWEEIQRVAQSLFADPNAANMRGGRGRKTAKKVVVVSSEDSALDDPDDEDDGASYVSRVTGMTLATAIEPGQVRSHDVEAELINGEQTQQARNLKAAESTQEPIDWPEEPEALEVDRTTVRDTDVAAAIMLNACAVREEDLSTELIELRTLTDTCDILLDQATKLERLLDNNRPMGAKSQRVGELIALQSSLLDHISRLQQQVKERRLRIRTLMTAATRARKDNLALQEMNAATRALNDRLRNEAKGELAAIDSCLLRARRLTKAIADMSDFNVPTQSGMDLTQTVSIVYSAWERLNRAATIVQAVYRGYRARAGKPCVPFVCETEPVVTEIADGGCSHSRAIGALTLVTPNCLVDFRKAFDELKASLVEIRTGVEEYLNGYRNNLEGMAKQIKDSNESVLCRRRITRFVQTIGGSQNNGIDEEVQVSEENSRERSAKGKRPTKKK
ncbi:hypothetical protein J8273_3179 [Carpediemonas membranifera]|uniref:Uncharacterized protein n=1 Tax=Carpediemonas membranifera TaxID=201153 RepID=A0A8J6AUU3_9EUKA|nr:hypothetical protein J8273_3179 [Carpediemonas membranifera]|eukprot:KAG9393050.1 hypothetical protein J8273_3179 [Carpediemonas membranifera]